VRFFGGSWGRALQLASLFSALLLLAILLVLSSGCDPSCGCSSRKNFFAYRFDYREQWLRFTNMLSAPASPQELGLLAIRGLADWWRARVASLWTHGRRPMTATSSTHAH
jgi:hypothetical protein